MKKYRKKRGLFLFITLLLASWLLPLSALAAPASDSLVQSLSFDAERRILSGETAPHANLSLTEVVVTTVADEHGHFEFLIPPELTQAELRVDDYLADRFELIDFDFTSGQALPASQNGGETRASTSDETGTLAGSAVPPPALAPKPAARKETPLALWLLLLVVVIAATVVGLLYLNSHRATTPPPAEKRRKKRRKRKKRS